MDSYGFLIAGFLVTMGTIGDRIGRRRLLMIGAAAFGVASVVAAYSATPEMLSAAVAGLRAQDPTAPIHIHIAEQTKEVEDCLAWSGQRPVSTT